MRELVAARARLERFDEPQPLPLLPHQTPEEHRWAEQRGERFCRVLPIDAAELVHKVAESSGKPLVELATELTVSHQLSAHEQKDTELHVCLGWNASLLPVICQDTVSDHHWRTGRSLS